MVLSNRKLKQKIREKLAQSLVESVAKPKTDPTNDGSENPDPKSAPRSLKVLLDSATQKPRLSKREKRRKILSLRGPEAVSVNGSGSNLGGNKGEEGKRDVGSEGLGVEKKKEEEKKRKRDDEEEKDGDLSAEENGVVKKESKKPKKKSKTKKNKKRKTGAKTEEEKKGGELGNGQQVVQETDINIDRQASGDVPTKVYVGGIPYYSTEDDIRSYFDSCGTITEVDCLRFPDSGKFRGIAIISFKTEAAAKRALALDGAEMGGLFLKIQPYKATRPNKPNKVSDFAPQIVEGYNRIYVGNLSWDITEDDLKKLFSDCKISSIHFGMDKETGGFRGYAHVNFSDSLSVMMALKLDQKVVCGRPVKISCAVPLKKAGTPSTPALTTPSTHSTFVASAMTTESIPVNTTLGGADDGGLSASKIKRRTCYECGEKGHLSSACSKSATTILSTDSIPLATTTSTDPSPVATDSGKGADNGGLSATSGKIKRRTCYECGEKGHLSSACPKSATTAFNTYSTPVAKTTSTDPTPVATATGADNGGLSDISGKIKRRTCYECGEKGHLSSACPKAATTPSSTHSIPVATVTSTGPIPVATTTSTAWIPVATTRSTDLPPDDTTTSTGADISSGLSASTGKIKRRTCYECGEKGHISSACPKKQTNAS